MKNFIRRWGGVFFVSLTTIVVIIGCFTNKDYKALLLPAFLWTCLLIFWKKDTRKD